MQKQLFILFLTALCWTGCRNKNPNLSQEELLTEIAMQEEAIAQRKTEKLKIEIPDGYTPPSGIRFVPEIVRPGSIINLDMQASLQNERRPKLSDFGKEAVYYRTGAFDYNQTVQTLIALKDGNYLGIFLDAAWLLDSDMKKLRKVIDFEVAIETHGETTMYNIRKSVVDAFYEEATEQLRCLLIDSENWWVDPRYVGTISLEGLLNSTTPFTVDDIHNRVTAGRGQEIGPVPEGYAISGMFVDGLYTFDFKGDTLCHFASGSQNTGEQNRTVRASDDNIAYTYNNEYYFRQAFSNRVYKLVGAARFQPVWRIDFGDKQVSREEGMSVSTDLSDKLLMREFTETSDHLFIRFTQNFASPNNRNAGTVKFHQAIYDKQSGELYSFTDRNKLSDPAFIPNDMDGLIPFWPNMAIRNQPVMWLRGHELKKRAAAEKLNSHPSLQNIEDTEIIFVMLK